MEDKNQNVDVPGGKEIEEITREEREVVGGLDKEQIEAMTVEQDDSNVSRPDLFSNSEERIRVRITIHYLLRNGKVIGIENADLPTLGHLEDIESVGRVTYEFVFSVPDYPRYSDYRRSCSVISGGSQYVDKLKLRNYLLLFHLVETDMPLKDDAGEDVEFSFDDSGDYRSLSNETMAAVYHLRPLIVEVLITIYERMAMLRF